MKNDCENLTLSGGCYRLYIPCPLYIRDNMEMGCGGACYEPPAKSDKEEENK